ncbi:MAG: peptidoglycan DD-metalloendopeptidase family protein [Rhodocyclaceae bacterium]|nr:peptidoglycan DD-metalloendopeptidase family protein [Rhodocyclaceae bacterium]
MIFQKRYSLRAAVLLATAALAACAPAPPAPVVDRSPAAAAAAPAVPRAGYHIVKKGDTLYSIAQEHGQDWRDVKAWNAIDNPNLLRIGQELRVESPDGAAVSKPVAAPAAIDVRPLGPAAAAPAVDAARPAAGADNLKRAPKGGIKPYSEETLALARREEGGDVAVAAAAPAAGAAASEAKPEARPPAKADAPAADNAGVAAGDTAVEWAWPYRGKILTGFGEGTSKGLDIAGNAGDPVLAAAKGRVILVSESVRAYGKLVVVKHSDTYLSVYANNSKFLVKEGESVARGQKIAEVGMSPGTPGLASLHFEIRRQGKPVDPLKFLPAR